MNALFLNRDAWYQTNVIRAESLNVYATFEAFFFYISQTGTGYNWCFRIYFSIFSLCFKVEMYKAKYF